WEITKAACSRRAVRMASQHDRHDARLGRVIFRSSQLCGLAPKNSQRIRSRIGPNHLHEGSMAMVAQTTRGRSVINRWVSVAFSTRDRFIRRGTLAPRGMNQEDKHRRNESSADGVLGRGGVEQRSINPATKTIHNLSTDRP